VAKHSILGQLFRDGPKTPKALALAEGIQPQSLTRVLAELEESGFALRTQDELDRRQFKLEITSEGRRLVIQDANNRASWLASAMDTVLTAFERDLLCLSIQLLDKLADASSLDHASATDNKQGDRPMGAGDVRQLDVVFAKVKARFDERNRDGLICKQGFYNDCSVLKLQKASWTNDPMDRVQNKSGIFFSIWMNEASTRKNRASYNIHALKLRQLKGYSITSRDFANDFRNGFESMRDTWPNVSVDYGPLTLMEGWIEIDSNGLGKDILVLMERFKHLSPLIDRLLESRRR
jgi:DNA-binding MarR family transcriptional regulator